MARRRSIVTHRRADPAQLPTCLVEPALLLNDLEGRGVVAEVAERIRINRQQGSFAGVDVWALLLVFLASGAQTGVRPFWEILGPFSKQIAALARRKQFPSPGSLSRALSAVENEMIRPQASWLLTEAPDIDAVLMHTAALHYDALGQGWHVFDIDPTVTTLRQRGLPVGDDLPDPVRRSQDTGAPGHAGRKRGDVQYRRVDVQHAGSGLFVHAHLHQGNGHGIEDLDQALISVDTLLERLKLSKGHALVRLDGEFGTVPYFDTLRRHGLPFVTRANYPSLYDDPDVLARMRSATWHGVPDSGSGPTRAATDLGILTLSPSRDTRRPDGSTYEPIRVRVVASVFKTEGTGNRGRKLDGWQVELFAADVTPDAWPAPDVVAAYFGRASQENRFAQEDREVGLDRIFSYHLPGQELATLTGLFLLNYRIGRGFELDPPPSKRPQPVLRVPVVDHRLPAGWPVEPVVANLLRKLSWSDLLARRPGWSWDDERGELRCPDAGLLELSTIRPEPASSRKTGIIFRRPHAGCSPCDHREGCLASDEVHASKTLELNVDSKLAEALRKRLHRLRKRPDPDRGSLPEPIIASTGLHQVLAPRFLPREARRVFQELFIGASLRVTVKAAPPRPPPPRLVAVDDADRQQRRSTWTQRTACYALPEESVVRLDIATDRDIRAWMVGGLRAEMLEGAAS